MNYYFVSDKTDKILDALYCPGRDATVSEIEAIARSLANEAHCPVRVIKGKYTGLTFEPCLGHEKEKIP